MADGKVIIDTELDSSGVKSGLNKLSSTLGKYGKSTIKGITVATVAATTAVAGLVTKSIEAYGTYEQLVGGVETLFGTQGYTLEEYAKSVNKTVSEVTSEYNTLKEAESIVMKNAADAYKNAGLSANQYMEQITSFSASLKQSLGGDTIAAAELGNQAIIDMSDNANKMGTDIQMIQNAYQGFAKQNYTMLDNLKLGYGGTKAEMERLLEDAEKLSGIEYDISSYADIIEAIHVIQDEMGITGTTAKEAASTIEGSTNSMKAAWNNLLVGMADDTQDFDQLIDNFVDSVDTWAGNIMPRIEKALNGVAQLIAKLAPKIADALPGLLADALPELLSAGVEIINALVTGIAENLPSLLSSLSDVFTQLLDTLGTMLPQLIDIIITSLSSLIQLIASNGGKIIDVIFKVLISIFKSLSKELPKIVKMIPGLISDIVDAIADNLPMLCEAGSELLISLMEGLLEALPELIDKLPDIITQIVDTLLGLIPIIIDCGIQLLMSLVKALPTIINSIVRVLPKIINGIVDALLTHLPEIIDCGITLLTALIDALPTIIETIVEALPQIIGGITGALLEHLDDIIACGVELFVALVSDMPKILESIGSAVLEILAKIDEVLGGALSDLFDMGVSLFTSLWDGIKSVGSEILDWVGGFVSNLLGLENEAFTSVVDSATKLNQVGTTLHGNRSIRGSGRSRVSYNASGSVVEKGEIAFLEGTGAEAVVPLDQNHKWISKVASDMANTLYTQNTNLVDAVSSSPEVNVNVSLEGEAQELFKLIQKQDLIYRKSNGRSAFA